MRIDSGGDGEPGRSRRPRRDPALGRLLDQLIASGAANAAVAAVADGAGVRVAGAGRRAADDPRPPGLASRFDLASLTKPVVATLALRLDAGAELVLATPIGALGAGAHPRLARRRLGTLLRHRAGLVPWTPLMLRSADAEEAAALLVAGGREGELLGAPPGTYSDLGYLLWGFLAERALGAPLADLVARQVARPLGLTLRPSPGPRPGVVACALDNAREVALAAEAGFDLAADHVTRRGTAQDGNARFLAGRGASLTGHAGLFGSARDLLRLAEAWLDPEGSFLAPAARRRGLAGACAAAQVRRCRRAPSATSASPAAAFGSTPPPAASTCCSPTVWRAIATRTPGGVAFTRSEGVESPRLSRRLTISAPTRTACALAGRDNAH